MPTYDIIDTETGDYWEEFTSYSSLQQLLKDNPQFQLLPSAPAIISGVSGLTHKNDSGFKDMMQRIADANPHSSLAQTHGSKGIKESKTRAAVNKVREKLSKT